MRHRHIGTILLAFILSFTMMPAFATLDLELTQGISAAQPIALVSFQGQYPSAPGDQSINQIIQNDLTNSGEFRFINGNESPYDIKQVNFAYWKHLKVNDLITGSVTNTGGTRYRIHFQLIDIYNNNLLADETFNVSAQQLRVAAHDISDSVYQKLTGVRGIFNTKLAYVLVQRNLGQPPRYSLMVSDADGFNPRPLLTSNEPIMSPSWMPSGRELAYVSFEHERATIYVQNLATGQRQVISSFPGINGAPAFSPDGTKLALVLTLTGNPKIYVMNLATHKLTQVTQGWYIDTEPTWTADSSGLYFTSNRDGTPQIYRLNLANHQVSRVTYNGNYNAKANIGPQQKYLVMMHEDTDTFGIAEQDLTTGQLNILTQTGFDESPSLAPNGKMVLYATQYGGREVLGLVSTDGRIKLRLPSNEGEVQDPAWSPFLNAY